MGKIQPRFPQIGTALPIPEEYVLDPPGSSGTQGLASVLSHGNDALDANLIQGLQAVVLSSQNGGATVALIGFNSNPGAGLGYAAPIGSVGFAANGTIWIKTGALATQWTQIPTGGLASVLAASNDAVGDTVQNMGYLNFKTQTPAGTSSPDIIGVDSDPSVGAGISATLGSFAIAGDGTLWAKTGALDTQWSKVFPLAGLAPVGAGAFVQSIAWATIASGAVMTFGVAPTNGNTLVLYSVSNAHHITGIVQVGVAWTKASKTVNNNGNVGVAEIWIGVVAGGVPATTAIVTYDADNVQAVYCEEWSGLSTVDGSDSWIPYTVTGGLQLENHQFMWPTLGGRTFLVGQNSTGGAWVNPPGWTPSVGTPFNYGGSGEGYAYTFDAFSGGGKTGLAAQIAPATTDNHEVAMAHLVP